jgi:HSP20 family protein
MSKLTVPTRRAGDPAVTIFRSIEAAVDAIRRRAYELFCTRGGAPENDLDDWFRAERELFEVPTGEVTETEESFVVNVSVPGFQADQLQVTLEDLGVTIQGQSEKKRERKGERQSFSEVTRKELFRRFSIPAEFDDDNVKAELTKDQLRITLPKVAPTEPQTSNTVAAVSVKVEVSEPEKQAA